MKKFILILLLLPAVLISAGFINAKNMVIKGDVSVEGECIKGLLVADAKSILLKKVKEEASEKSLKIHGKSYIYRYYYPEIDVITNINEVVNAAYNKGKKFSGDFIIEREYYLKNMEAILDGIERENYRDAEDAVLSFNPRLKNMFFIKDERAGYRLNRDKLRQDICRSINGKENTVYCDYRVISPKITKKDLAVYTAFRGSFKTFYGNSQDERKHNIKLAAKKLSGSMILDSAVYSFNETVGRRTEANGFKTAKIILDGKFVEGTGGGVCQASTTLYNAAILSGLEVTEWHNHSLLVSYVKPSMDAMVNGSASDLKIKNTSGGPVFIKATADGEYINIEFYGKALPKGITYKLESVTLEKISPDKPEIVVDTAGEYCDIFEGESRVVEYEKEGTVSEGYLLTLKDGAVVGRKRLRKDKYKPVRGKIIRGTQKRVIPEPPDEAPLLEDKKS